LSAAPARVTSPPSLHDALPIFDRAGLELLDWFPYFSRRAHHALDLGHYLGLPSLVTRKLLGRWIMVPARWNLALTERTLRPFYEDRKSTRLNSSHVKISYAVFC